MKRRRCSSFSGRNVSGLRGCRNAPRPRPPADPTRLPLLEVVREIAGLVDVRVREVARVQNEARIERRKPGHAKGRVGGLANVGDKPPSWNG